MECRRALTFKCSQHRVSPFRLVDPSKPGHRRFIALWLVDPTRRIVSTANVPPQRWDWYMESLLGDSGEERRGALKKLPAELVTLLQKNEMIGNGEREHLETSENPKLNAELLKMVREYLEVGGKSMLMGIEEAKEHRGKLMQERTAFVKTAEMGWRDNSYSFCEH